ncbi:MAG: hypothetical protein GXP56_02185 [Deltaproteobacteria bacterium]|nr:hypothetical protein [Deltaproteobacteria bacterium]
MSKLKTIPVKTWQFFNACKQNLGITSLTSLFKVGPRQIDRWACDPDFTESSQRNPLDRYETLLKKLMDRGVDDIARAEVDRQVKIVGCTMRVNHPVPDKGSITEELLDNLPAMAAYQEAARPEANQPLAVIREKARALIQEIEEDLALIEETVRE